MRCLCAVPISQTVRMGKLISFSVSGYSLPLSFFDLENMLDRLYLAFAPRYPHPHPNRLHWGMIDVLAYINPFEDDYIEFADPSKENWISLALVEDDPIPHTS